VFSKVQVATIPIVIIGRIRIGGSEAKVIGRMSTKRMTTTMCHGSTCANARSATLGPTSAKEVV